jgi:hypothetical protein
VLVIYTCDTNILSFVLLFVNLLQMDDGLEFSFTDKRRFAKIRLVDNVMLYGDHWSNACLFILCGVSSLIYLVCMF